MRRVPSRYRGSSNETAVSLVEMSFWQIFDCWGDRSLEKAADRLDVLMKTGGFSELSENCLKGIITTPIAGKVSLYLYKIEIIFGSERCVLALACRSHTSREPRWRSLLEEQLENFMRSLSSEGDKRAAG